MTGYYAQHPRALSIDVSIRVSGGFIVTRTGFDVSNKPEDCFNPRERRLHCDCAILLAGAMLVYLFQSA